MHKGTHQYVGLNRMHAPSRSLRLVYRRVAESTRSARSRTPRQQLWSDGTAPVTMHNVVMERDADISVVLFDFEAFVLCRIRNEQAKAQHRCRSGVGARSGCSRRALAHPRRREAGPKFTLAECGRLIGQASARSPTRAAAAISRPDSWSACSCACSRHGIRLSGSDQDGLCGSEC